MNDWQQFQYQLLTANRFLHVSRQDKMGFGTRRSTWSIISDKPGTSMIDSCQEETEVPLHLDGGIPAARELHRVGFRTACGRFSRLTRQCSQTSIYWNEALGSSTK